MSPFGQPSAYFARFEQRRKSKLAWISTLICSIVCRRRANEVNQKIKYLRKNHKKIE